MSYVPDRAKVREKMTYASTKGTVKLALGGGSFTSEYFGTIPVRINSNNARCTILNFGVIQKDFTLDAYNKWIAHQRAEAPLTQAEKDRKEEVKLILRLIS